VCTPPALVHAKPLRPLTIRASSSIEHRIVETNFSIVCVCLPCLKPLVKYYFPKLSIFDPHVEQRVVSSFRLSNRVAHFGQPSTDDGHNASGDTLPAGANSNVLRPKPSAGSGSFEDECGMRDEKAAYQAHSSTVRPLHKNRLRRMNIILTRRLFLRPEDSLFA